MAVSCLSCRKAYSVIPDLFTFSHETSPEIESTNLWNSYDTHPPPPQTSHRAKGCGWVEWRYTCTLRIVINCRKSSPPTHTSPFSSVSFNYITIKLILIRVDLVCCWCAHYIIQPQTTMQWLCLRWSSSPSSSSSKPRPFWFPWLGMERVSLNRGSLTPQRHRPDQVACKWENRQLSGGWCRVQGQALATLRIACCWAI